uniref:Uncharacterized protein n=1 Tax=Leersia perrieri TaxID=77586 RepID=A0A0D9WSM3_9ORYZ
MEAGIKTVEVIMAWMQLTLQLFATLKQSGNSLPGRLQPSSVRGCLEAHSWQSHGVEGREL